MLWARDIPQCVFEDEAGRKTQVTVVAGVLGGHKPPPPPPHSWASRQESDVAIWCIRMAPRAKWVLPAAADARTGRVVYFFEGVSVRVGDHAQKTHAGLVLRGKEGAPLEAGEDGCELLLLQGRPIGEPVAQVGPFVMNTPGEIEEAIADYQRTHFGGWPWSRDDPVHSREDGRFAKHADGTVERIP
jgi:redox-sensitive bicupin YhaK (pirin superfamily)